MKVGDLVRYQHPGGFDNEAYLLGTIIDFLPSTHPKQFKKIKVLTDIGIENWIMQFCEVINESR
jgi:hypothetical protein